MILLKNTSQPKIAEHICNPSNWEVEARGWRIQGQSELHSETLSQNKTAPLKKSSPPQVCFPKRLYLLEATIKIITNLFSLI
jgi:hypothetical protein